MIWEKTPTERAVELFNRYGNMLAKEHDFRSIAAAKKCALIAVDEIINAHEGAVGMLIVFYWADVKTELEKL